MRLRTSIAVLACTFLMFGCNQQKSATVTAGNQCIQADTESATCEQDNGSGPFVCHVYIFNVPQQGTAKETVVFPYRLNVPAGQQNVKIVWHLIEKNMEFLPVHGPQELKTNIEFVDEGVISPNKRRYRFLYKNTIPSQTHSYTIKFRNARTGKEFSCDPLINNAGA